MNWFSRHRIYDDMKIWQSKCAALFQESDCRSMAEIEHALKIIRQEFIGRKEYV